MNKYKHAMKIRGELEDLMFDDKVLGTMDIKYKCFIGKEIHIDDWTKLYDECSEIIKEALEKAEKFDEAVEWFRKWKYFPLRNEHWLELKEILNWTPPIKVIIKNEKKV